MENNIYNIIYSGKTEKGMKENNEDDYITTVYERNNENKDKIYLLAVADGLGGHASGELASKIAIMELWEKNKNNKIKIKWGKK